MIRDISEMPQLARRLLCDVETEVVEYKEAKQAFDFDKIGRYFSALSNEANLRGTECGWLLFGIKDDRTVCGTAFRKEPTMPSIGLRKLKHELTQFTNDSMTFDEIYEFELDGKRVVAFQIPAGTFARPTTWKGVPWSRENESLVEMPQFKLQAIYGQVRPDWSKQIAYDASLDDLDREAVAFACKRYRAKYMDTQTSVMQLDDKAILSKMGLLIHNSVTNAALVLLGKPESVVFLGGNEPRITWSLYASDGRVIAYEHFDPPFILQVDKVQNKIRNEKFRIFVRDDTLFPVEELRYSPEVIRELLHNAIAHQDYRLSGKINVLEYEDRLIFKNEGSFIPGSVRTALAEDYKPPYYRNSLLSAAMGRTGMIDQNSIGIRNVFSIQKERFYPLPTYDLSIAERVSVTLFGKILNENYSMQLASNPNISLETAVLLDMVQKGAMVTKEECESLRSLKLVEGRYPRLRIAPTSDVSNQSSSAAKRKPASENERIKRLILEAIASGSHTKNEIYQVILPVMPADLSFEQSQRKVANLLQQLRKDGLIMTIGATSSAQWHLSQGQQQN